MILRLTERALRKTARRGMLAARAGFLRLTHASGLSARELDPRAIRRILAVRLDRLGDLVLTLPALDDLANAYPNAHRAVMVPPAHAPLLRGRSAIHRVVVAEHDGDVGALAIRIAAIEPDLAPKHPVDDCSVGQDERHSDAPKGPAFKRRCRPRVRRDRHRCQPTRRPDRCTAQAVGPVCRRLPVIHMVSGTAPVAQITRTASRAIP